MTRTPKPKRKPTRDQIRVWLVTVLSPMLRALDVELEFASRRNWSFRCDSQDFEYLWPTSMMVGALHYANKEQVFRYYPSLRTNATFHDRALASLRDSCQKAYKNVIQSARFQQLRIPADTQSDPRKYFAEYVVNGVRDLPSHYTCADFWKANGPEYLELRSEPSLVSSFRSLKASGESFRKRVVALRQSVKQLQESIADQAGLAPVEPTLV